MNPVFETMAAKTGCQIKGAGIKTPLQINPAFHAFGRKHEGFQHPEKRGRCPSQRVVTKAFVFA